MTQRTWLIVGATSIIAEEFSHLVCQEGQKVILVGRNADQLAIIAQDLSLRYGTHCEVVLNEFAQTVEPITQLLASHPDEIDLFIAHSDFAGNEHLTLKSIQQLISVNILATTELIHAYLSKEQAHHNLLFLSSVAACRGRAKNSLYGGSKAAIEVYLEGLQQAASTSQTISIARLGFIDTRQTYGVAGVFYAAPPKACAKACLKAIKKGKRRFYFPAFWSFIMAVITRMPFFIYKKLAL